MRAFTLPAVTLFTVLSCTKVLFAAEKDTLTNRSILIQVTGGSVTNIKGYYFSSAIQYESQNFHLQLQYQNSEASYIKLDNYTGFLEETNSGAVSAGYIFPLKKFSFLLEGGIHIGKGRFANHGSSVSLIWGNEEWTNYFETGFFGFIFNAGARFNCTDRLAFGLSFSTLFNYYSPYRDPFFSKPLVSHVGNFYCPQVSISYKFLKWHGKTKASNFFRTTLDNLSH